MSKMNRLANANNEFQGDFKRVLCVCSAGMLRSPTAAEILSREPYNFNTRAAGISNEYALVPVDDVLVHWADEIVCMEREHADYVRTFMSEYDERPVYTLAVPDMFKFRDPRLVEWITERYEWAIKQPKEPTIEKDEDS